jgi:hypothetical protein
MEHVTRLFLLSDDPLVNFASANCADNQADPNVIGRRLGIPEMYFPLTASAMVVTTES